MAICEPSSWLDLLCVIHAYSQGLANPGSSTSSRAPPTVQITVGKRKRPVGRPRKKQRMESEEPMEVSDSEKEPTRETVSEGAKQCNAKRRIHRSILEGRKLIVLGITVYAQLHGTSQKVSKVDEDSN